jgi:hypothetical protein
MRKGFGSEALDESKGLQKIIAASKTSGALNLSNRQLQEVPHDVFSLPENDDSVKWWEVGDPQLQPVQAWLSNFCRKQVQVTTALQYQHLWHIQMASVVCYAGS